MRQDDEVATGRLILLHDPAGHEAWEGTLRLVTYVTAELEPELATDPLLPGVGWSWLTDALDALRRRAPRDRRHGDPDAARPASATWPARRRPPTSRSAPPGRPSTADLAAHLRAWCEVLASTAGLRRPASPRWPNAAWAADPNSAIVEIQRAFRALNSTIADASVS